MNAPTQAEIAEVDAGINQPWAELADTERHPDPVIAAQENDRDLYYARGNYDSAEQAHRQALSMVPDPAFRPEDGGRVMGLPAAMQEPCSPEGSGSRYAPPLPGPDKRWDWSWFGLGHRGAGGEQLMQEQACTVNLDPQPGEHCGLDWFFSLFGLEPTEQEVGER